MNKILKQLNRERKKTKIRSKISGSLEKPRCSVFRSLNNISVQLIDDESQKTIMSLNNVSLDLKKMTKVQESFEVGKKLAEMAISKGIKTIVFDRNGYLYHGRVKAVADGLRDGGLQF